MDVDEFELIPSVSKRPLTWDIAYSDLRELESAGKGSIGDYVRSMWKDKEVSLPSSLPSLLSHSPHLSRSSPLPSVCQNINFSFLRWFKKFCLINKLVRKTSFYSKLEPPY
jgi:hypothetical protein